MLEFQRITRLSGLCAAALLLGACQPSASAPASRGPASAAKPAASAAASSSSAAPSNLTPEVQRLLTAAKDKAENEFGVSWSENSLGGSAGIKRFEATFNRMYGANVRMTHTPGPSMPNMVAKVVQEVAAGQKASSDVLLATDGQYVNLLKGDTLEEVDWAKISPRVVGDMMTPRGLGVEIYSTIPAILLNTDAVKSGDRPKTLDDTLAPKWKGKIASDVDGAYFDVVAARPEWGVDRMKNFVTRLSQNIGGLIRVGEESRLESGEFDMMVLGNTHSVFQEKVKGAPLDYVVPDDVASVRFVYLGVPRTSAHPNLAKLFINMVMSEEGQRTLFEVYYSDHYALPGSQSGKDLQALKARGGSVLEVNVQYQLAHPDIGQLDQAIRDILREKKTA